MLRIFRVKGESMQPVLYEGDFVVALVAFRWAKRARPGRKLVVQHPEYGVIIKRVVSVEPDGSCWLGSDNQSGISTQQIGKITPSQIIGRVLWCVKSGHSSL